MQLSVSDSGSLSFVVSCYNVRCASAKSLASRLRNILITSKEASDLRVLLDYFRPYVIECKLKDMYRMIDTDFRYGYRDSILSVSWLDDGSCIPCDDFDGLSISRGDTAASCSPPDDTGSEGGSLALSDDFQPHHMSTSPVAGRYVLRNIDMASDENHFRPLQRVQSENVYDRTSVILRAYGSADNLTNHHHKDINGNLDALRYYRYFYDSLKDINATSYEPSSPIDAVSPRSNVSGIAMLSQLCTPEFVVNGCSINGPSQSRSMDIDGLSTTPLNMAQSLNNDISENERSLLSSLCRLLRGMLVFIADAVNHELRWLSQFDASLVEVIELLDGVVSEGGSMMKKLKEMLKSYSSTYAASLTAYEKALSRFQKFEKALEAACAARSSITNGNHDVLNCPFEGCPSRQPDYKHNRNVNRSTVCQLLSSSKDFIRYTNYIEQMCLAHHTYDTLEKYREYCSKGLTDVLATFSEHYPRTVFCVEVFCLEKLTGIASVLMYNTSSKSRNLALCLNQLNRIPADGVIDLHYSINIDSPNMKDRLHSIIVECFDGMRSLSKKLSQLHHSQMDRLSRFSSRHPLKLCDMDVNAMFKSYHKYNKHMYSTWWSIYTTIASVFPKSTSGLRRTKETSDPVLGEFFDIKMPLKFLRTIASQFEELLETASQDTFNVCSAALNICANTMDWTSFVTSMASENNLDADEVNSVIGQLQQDIFEKNNCEVDSLYRSLGRRSTDSVGPLVVLTNSLPLCESSAIMSKMLCVLDQHAEAVVDYNEVDYNFRFNRGEMVHVRISGNTPLWYGHTVEGVDRWFPAKFVKLLSEPCVPLFRRADLECYTYLDCYRVDDHEDGRHTEPVMDRGITLTSKATLKQALMLSRLGLEGKVEHEFKCALCRKIVLRGSLYLTKTHIGFVSSFNDATLFGPETTLTVPVEDIMLCNLTSSKTLSFYVRLVLRNNETHTFYSVRYARRIRDCIVELAKLHGGNETATVNSAESVTLNSSLELKDAFGALEPLAKSLPPVSLQMSLKKYFFKSLRDNVSPGSIVAETRLSQSAFEFGGTLEPVDFDWDADGVQVHKRQIHYSFRLKEGKYTALLPRHACGKAREDLKYALVDGKHLIYESTSYTSDIPYSSYFYTILRITVTSTSPYAIVVKAEYDVKFVKSTFLASVINGEACERLCNSAHKMLLPFDDSANGGSQGSPRPTIHPPVLSPRVHRATGCGLPPVLWACVMFFVIYTGLLSGWH
ncbi:uncharacterized protein BXIN_3009 [Babesia sp. Xinjiang]|uniref:uncharacterized protein n=1 Tax=Babesia sp. Xinjiang TaxID=462227 RepID=UPI000A2233B7|nr:uncharacterized protein BXIN_3009 [Babesia sp. Xinjiang]ORM39397.1 hypothetical protein BXIN_3009 [Babesia sp. Xinjiang]